MLRLQSLCEVRNPLALHSAYLRSCSVDSVRDKRPSDHGTNAHPAIGRISYISDASPTLRCGVRAIHRGSLGDRAKEQQRHDERTVPASTGSYGPNPSGVDHSGQGDSPPPARSCLPGQDPGGPRDGDLGFRGLQDGPRVYPAPPASRSGLEQELHGSGRFGVAGETAQPVRGCPRSPRTPFRDYH